MKFRIALVAATILALPIAAKAQPYPGLYIAGGVGVNFMANEKAELSTLFGTTNGSWLKTNAGPMGDLSIGYGFGYGLRAELEGLYTYNHFSGGHQEEQKYGPMVNLLYDYPLTPTFQPYVGVGVGYLWAKESASVPTPLGGVTVNGTKGNFAYQGIIGASIPLNGITPGLALTGDYRFVGLAGSRTYSNVKLSNDYNNIFTVGFRYTFGVPPAPAPVAAPAPVTPAPVTRSYLVFFDWDKAVLTDRARQIVSEAAANSTKVQYTRLEVNGYTDTSGTAAYNQRLSVRRAQAVAAELVKDGVPKAAISIQGFGETHLLVPTGPGVREPQNRRVEIIIT